MTETLQREPSRTDRPELRRELLALRRRSRLAVGLRAFALATLTIAVLLCSACVAARMFAVSFPPTAGWALGLVPALGYAVWQVRRRDLDLGALAAHVDRRTGSRGLLLATRDAEAGAWGDRLADHLRRAAVAARPRVELRRPTGQVAAAGLLVFGVSWLPAPTPESIRARVGQALELAVEETLEEVQLALEQGAVSEEEGVELEQRAKDLHERLLTGDPVAWSDVDALRDDLAMDQSQRLGGLQSVQAGLDELKKELESRGAEDFDASQFARLAERAKDLGLLEDLPPDQREALEQALEQFAEQQSQQSQEGSSGAGAPEMGQGLDPSDLGLDTESLQKLAEALQGAAGKRMKRGGQDAKIAPDQLQNLRDLLEQEGLGRTGGAGTGEGEGSGKQRAVGEGWDPTPPDGEGQEGGVPGRGGLGRGRGDATLEFEHQTDIDIAQLKPEKLAEGNTVPDRWQVIGVSRANPTADPDRATGPGGVAGEGAGRSTFRRSLAPRHREAVRRFFSDPPSGGR